MGEHLIVKNYSIEILEINNHVYLTILKNLLWICMQYLFAKNETFSSMYSLYNDILVSFLFYYCHADLMFDKDM